MLFKVHCFDPRHNESRSIFFYDNQSGLLSDADHVAVGTPRPDLEAYESVTKAHNEQTPIFKSDTPRILKIQLGLSCNFSCSYCLQKHIPQADSASLETVTIFIDQLRAALKGEPQNIQLWGGEPLVYLRTLRLLVPQLEALFPSSRITMITNGSLLSEETNRWILEHKIGISISHDGPGQSLRGDDPFDDPIASSAIRDLYWRKKKLGDPISFGAMIHADNPDRSAVAAWLREKIGDPDILIGEGAIIAVYDDGALRRSPTGEEEHFALRRIAFRNTRHGADANFSLSHMRMAEWRQSMLVGRMLDSLGMKCGMDREDTLTVDLHGNVVTCQNSSATASAPNGRPHASGHVEALNLVRITTAKHFSFRSECLGCPVVQTCKGGCMYLDGELFRASCENNYTDHIPYLAAAVESITGVIPTFIEDEANCLPLSRKDIFGYGLPAIESTIQQSSSSPVSALAP